MQLLSETTGVIQWVDNARTLSQYIPSAHKRYYPDEYDYKTCIDMMKKALKKIKSKGAGQQLATFKTVCKNFSPVLRYFFLERYTSPDTWFARRCAYARSLAANSMVGYVLGIGDRHAGNVMIDELSGELLHIDFGIAFEQALTLAVPETVPFRLTRNMLDPLGTIGAKTKDGVFVRSSEVALSVLRQGKDVLLTILEVLAGSGTWEGETERQIARVKEKLNGFDDPQGSALSVEGSVRRLVVEATSEANLAIMWYGWSPFS